MVNRTTRLCLVRKCVTESLCLTQSKRVCVDSLRAEWDGHPPASVPPRDAPDFFVVPCSRRLVTRIEDLARGPLGPGCRRRDGDDQRRAHREGLAGAVIEGRHLLPLVGDPERGGGAEGDAQGLTRLGPVLLAGVTDGLLVTRLVC